MYTNMYAYCWKPPAGPPLSLVALLFFPCVELADQSDTKGDGGTKVQVDAEGVESDSSSSSSSDSA